MELKNDFSIKNFEILTRFARISWSLIINLKIYDLANWDRRSSKTQFVRKLLIYICWTFYKAVSAEPVKILTWKLVHLNIMRLSTSSNIMTFDLKSHLVPENNSWNFELFQHYLAKFEYNQFYFNIPENNFARSARSLTIILSNCWMIPSPL